MNQNPFLEDPSKPRDTMTEEAKLRGGFKLLIIEILGDTIFTDEHKKKMRSLLRGLLFRNKNISTYPLKRSRNNTWGRFFSLGKIPDISQRYLVREYIQETIKELTPPPQ